MSATVDYEAGPYGDLKRELARRFDDAHSYLHRPVSWTADKLNEYLWSAQRAVLDSVVAHRYTAVQSAHDLGKSMVAARAVAWWIDSHPPGEAFVVTTAPTAAQVAAILWREVSKAHGKGHLPGRINRAGYPQWYLGNELVGYGRKPADYEESAFQGIHAKYVLIVIDEAGGVARHLYDAVDALATNEYARVLAIGNPDDPGSHFASICKPGSGWNVLHLDGLRSPNMTREAVLGTASEHDLTGAPYPLTAALMMTEGVPFSTEPLPEHIRPYLLSALWVEERIVRWCGVSAAKAAELAPDELGELIRRRAAASPLFQAKVRGIFPTSVATGVIPLGWVQQAVNRWKDWSDGGGDLSRVPNPAHLTVGVDVAYGGQDETCLAPRYGDCIPELHRYRHADTVETAEYAAAHLSEALSAAVVDVIGIGAGVYDTLRRWRREGIIRARVLPFNAAANTAMTDKIGEFRFRNDRAAAWWRFREKLDPSRGSRVMLPDDERLIEELVAVKYKHLAGGIIQIESKDDIRTRLGRSTDSADAVIQAFWIDNLPGDFEPDVLTPDRRGADVVHYDGYSGWDADDFAVAEHTATGYGSASIVVDEGWDLSL